MWQGERGKKHTRDKIHAFMTLFCQKAGLKGNFDKMVNRFITEVVGEAFVEEIHRGAVDNKYIELIKALKKRGAGDNKRPLLTATDGAVARPEGLGEAGAAGEGGRARRGALRALTPSLRQSNASASTPRSSYGPCTRGSGNQRSPLTNCRYARYRRICREPNRLCYDPLARSIESCRYARRVAIGRTA